METPAPQWQTTIFGMLIHPAEPRILLWSTDNGYVLPSFVLDMFDMSIIMQQMQQTLGTAIN